MENLLQIPKKKTIHKDKVKRLLVNEFEIITFNNKKTHHLQDCTLSQQTYTQKYDIQETAEIKHKRKIDIEKR